MKWSSRIWDSVGKMLEGDESDLRTSAESGNHQARAALRMFRVLPGALAVTNPTLTAAGTDRLLAIFRPPTYQTARLRTSSTLAMARGGVPMHAVYEAGDASIQVMVASTELGNWVMTGRIQPPSEGLAFTDESAPVRLDSDGRFRLDLGSSGSIPVYLQTPVGRVSIPAREEDIVSTA